MLTLYQFPLSHYCEKVRWALDYKKIPYRSYNLIPGAHLLTTKRLAHKTSVPILVDGKSVIQDSTRIIDYLEEHYPQNPLNPSDPNLRNEALELEEYFDKKIGPHLRRLAYFHILEDRPLVTSLLLQNSSWYGKPFYGLLFPAVKTLMKKSMNIYKEPTEKSVKVLEEAFEFLNEKIEGKKFLVGKQFTRADLTAAALLGPLCTPPEYHFQWPDPSEMPLELQKYKLTKEKEPFFGWVLNTYKNYR